MLIPPGMAILVVDDHHVMRKTIAYFLRQLGITNILFAEDGEAAWKIINDTRVDLLLLDWNMPHMSGLDLLERIRQSEAYEEMPVVMVTAESGEEHVLSAIAAGVTDYIVKPFAPIVLHKKVAEVVARPAVVRWLAR